MNQNFKNDFWILMTCFAVLILGIWFEVLIFKTHFESCACEIQNEKPILYQQDMSNFVLYKMPEFEIEESEPEDEIFFPITEDDFYTICCIVAGEAKGEPTEGKMAVAQCILNAMAKDQISASEVRTKYKYSGWDSNLRNSNPELWIEIEDSVRRVFDNGEFVSENPILFFYAPKYVAGKWHETLEFDSEIGGHRFFYLDEDVNADWFLGLI